MKGKILDFNIQNSSGIISAEDGNRYNFITKEWRSDKSPAVNQTVDFSIEGENATAIYLEQNNILEQAGNLNSIVKNNDTIDFFLRAYRNYVNFQGRDTRQQYWMFYLFYMIAYIVLSVIDAVIGTGGILGGIFALGSLLPSIAIATRRLHDTNRSGWWQLLVLIPLIGAIVLIIFLAQKGTMGDNKFGKDPLNTGNEDGIQ